MAEGAGFMYVFTTPSLAASCRCCLLSLLSVDVTGGTHHEHLAHVYGVREVHGDVPQHHRVHQVRAVRHAGERVQHRRRQQRPHPACGTETNNHAGECGWYSLLLTH